VEFYKQGSFLYLDGPAKRKGLSFSKTKVCMTCRHESVLRDLLLEIARNPGCYWVKMSVEPKDGMFLGRCFFTTSEMAGKMWARYRSHPLLLVNLQDDDFVSQFRI
jgi:hypothetical protein